MPNPDSKADGEPMPRWVKVSGVILILLVAPAAYPTQLLLIRRNYYRNAPIAASTRAWTHICRIIQLLHTIILAWMAIATIRNIYITYEEDIFVDRFDYLRAAMTLAMCISIPFNLLIFFKGWRLLKFTESDYIDDVMAGFGEGASRQ